MMETMNLEEAAAFLKLHPTTLSEMARRKEVPCAKPGKRYVFIKEDLVGWIRSSYKQEPVQCPSSSEAVSIGSIFVTAKSVSAKLQGLRSRPTRSGYTMN
jgi:excisionase family DNA binding protein